MELFRKFSFVNSSVCTTMINYRNVMDVCSIVIPLRLFFSQEWCKVVKNELHIFYCYSVLGKG